MRWIKRLLSSEKEPTGIKIRVWTSGRKRRSLLRLKGVHERDYIKLS